MDIPEEILKKLELKKQELLKQEQKEKKKKIIRIIKQIKN
tara:strand:- start:2703 stop:2822 length:120 start_codon:yes stop_codon:yes gene_type:complete